MKKVSFVSLILVVFMLLLSACGGNTETKADPESKPDSNIPKSNFPTKPVTFIVPYAPGGATDTVSRAFASALEKQLGQPVTIKNVDGGGGTVGITELANAEPDGYTVGALISGVLAFTPHIQDVEYNMDSFTYLGVYGTNLTGIAVKKDSPYQNVGDLIEAAKQKTVNISNPVPGGSITWLFETLNDMYGTKFVSIPVNSGAEAVSQVLGGHTEALASNGVIMASGDDIKLLAATGEERWPYAPDVATLKEQGFDVAFDAFMGLGAPSGLPQEIVEIYEAAVQKALEDPQFIEVTNKFYTPPSDKSGSEFKVWLEELYEKVGPFMKTLK